MSQKMLKGILEKNLKVKKAPNVRGSVSIHFPNPIVQDIILKDFSEVEIFKRINITEEDIKTSNLSILIARGDIVIV